MAKVAIIYWSGTGNTEAMADFVKEGVESAGGQAELFNVSQTQFGADVLSDFDSFAFGCPAMGDEELEEDEFAPVYDECEPKLGSSKVALFGSYDWNEGEWMEIWKDRASDAGLNLVGVAVAKDYPDDEAAEACREIGSSLV